MLTRTVFLTAVALATICSWHADATAQNRDVLTSTNDAPAYTISNLRHENDRFGKSMLVFDFRRTRKGTGTASIVGRSKDQRISISASVPSYDDQGSVRLSSFFGNKKIDNIEIFLAVNQPVLKGLPKQMMVSNSIRIGNPGVATQARAWTEDDRAAVAEYKAVMADDSAHKPKRNYKVTVKPPKDHGVLPNNVIVTAKTPLQACYAKKWETVTALSQNDDGTINVTWQKWGRSSDCSMDRAELIISATALKSLKKDPSITFVPTTLPDLPEPNGMILRMKEYKVTIDPPAGSQFIPPGAEIPAGTKVQACYSSKWNPLTVLACNEDDSISVHWDDYSSSFDCRMKREELIIAKSTLKSLGIKVAEGSMPAAKPKPIITPTGGESLVAPLKAKNYSVSISPPSGWEFVPQDVFVPKNTPLQACYAGKWNPITTLSNATDGTLNIRWDDYGASFDCSMVRNQLVIQKTLVRKLRSSAPKEPMRLWKDSTGRFSIRARMTANNGTSVTLFTEKGEEKTLPISRLSDADQEYLKSNKPKNSDNPFQ